MYIYLYQDVINKSDHQLVLRLSNLVEGVYRFRLTVKDAKGMETSDDALITVKQGSQWRNISHFRDVGAVIVTSYPGSYLRSWGVALVIYIYIYIP